MNGLLRSIPVRQDLNGPVRSVPGMRVFDHCGRPRVAVSQLADMLPELGPGGPPPGPPASAPGLRTVGILDGAGLTRTDADADLEVRHALAAAMVPVAAVDSSHLVQPMQRAQVG